MHALSAPRNANLDANDPWTTGQKEFFEPNLYLSTLIPAASASPNRSFARTSCWSTKRANLIQRLPLRSRLPFLRRPRGRSWSPRAKEAALAILIRLERG